MNHMSSACILIVIRYIFIGVKNVSNKEEKNILLYSAHFFYLAVSEIIKLDAVLHF